ncbi:hypothetical protein F5Y13DRAFT_205439 [Hypoxylon sp. FL1857]|nr:hypothetical protein F5Y13DRAFT_205439 [Hypoxylon sp. FL1857]
MEYLNPYNDDTLNNATIYEFVTELSPGVWKVCRKTDRIEFLAHEVTDQLTTNPREPDENQTDLAFIVNSAKPNVSELLGRVLNHENLVNLIQMLVVQKTSACGRTEQRTYAIWDFCDAGNLGNLIMNLPMIVSDRTTYDDDKWDKNEYEPKKDLLGYPSEEEDDYVPPEYRPIKPEEFLPESFCWHVLISVLKALAWLHNGSRDITMNNGRIVMQINEDWQPMLHRNITPTNIFLAHPRRDEWYGSCKLGNYERLYISGHYNGGPQETVRPRNRGLALAPPRSIVFQPLEELVLLHEQYGHSYPPKPDQPYTIVSEWRALGEIMQAMMINSMSAGHIARLRREPVIENLRNTKYSSLLKNMVVALMTVNPEQKEESGKYRWTTFERHNLTTRLCCKAFEDWRKWRLAANPEARGLIVADPQMAQQEEEDAWERDDEVRAMKRTHKVLAIQDDLFDERPKIYEEDPDLF